MTANVLVPIAEGTEEIEAVTIIDVLRRAEANVTVASVAGLEITASRGVKIVADCLIEECKDRDFDLIALPGGIPGAEHLRDHSILKELLLRQYRAGRLYGAICASPAVVLAPHGLLKNKKATCHPAFIDELQNTSQARSPVVVDGNCVTSQGPGTAMIFSLKLVEMLFGEDKAKAVKAPMVIC